MAADETASGNAVPDNERLALLPDWRSCCWFSAGIACLLLLPTQAVCSSYYVAPNGDDQQAGSLESPWKTLSHAVQAVRPGDVVYLRGGTYFESEILVDAHGSPESPIKITSHSSEQPIIDGGFAEFRTAPNADWEVHDAAKGVFRSVKSYRSAKQVMGAFADEPGVDLIPYLDYETLCTDNEYYTERAPYFYMGPGVFWNPEDQRIYLRLKPSTYEQRMSHATVSELDPRKISLRLFPEGTLLEISGKSKHLIVEGLRFRGRKILLEYAAGAHHIELRNCICERGRYQILVREDAHDLLFDRLTISGGMPDWLPRNDVKRPRKARPAQTFQGAGMDFEGRVTNVEVRDCTFRHLFDGIDSHEPVGLSIHHNLFDVVRDDAIEVGSAGYEVQIAHNRLLGVAAGISWNGCGRLPAGKIGTKYIHHNVIVTNVPMLYGRADPQKILDSVYLGPKGDGFATGRAFGMHTKSEIKGPDPWKIYQNTIVGSADVDKEGLGVTYQIPRFDPSFPHEVYNNIFVQVADSNVLAASRVTDGSQIFDGNLYYRPARPSNAPEFVLLDAGGHTARFQNLSEFKNSPLWSLTRQYYTPGWEASGIEADPRLDREFVPAAGGPATTPGVDLKSKGWPGVEEAGFRGALAPAKHGRAAGE